MINLDYNSRIAIYEQIVMEIERYIALGILKENDKLPSIRQLAVELGINPNTVKKAYSILESKNIISSLSTKGTFITNKTKDVVNEKIDKEISYIKDKFKQLEKLGLTTQEIIKRVLE